MDENEWPADRFEGHWPVGGALASYARYRVPTVPSAGERSSQSGRHCSRAARHRDGFIVAEGKIVEIDALAGPRTRPQDPRCLSSTTSNHTANSRHPAALQRAQNLLTRSGTMKCSQRGPGRMGSA